MVGTEFRVVDQSGKLLSQEDLVGTVLMLGGSAGHGFRLRIDGVQHDARDPEITLYRLSSPSADDPDQWINVCDPDPDGNQLGFPMSGTWNTNGDHVRSGNAFSVTCTSGAEGKCVRFGYKPWRDLPSGVSLWDFHQACTRLLRADYCGDGESHTKNGTPVDIFDRVGIERDEPDPGMSFEAAWAIDGAACVRRTRVADPPSLDLLAEECPERRQRFGPACDETASALLFDRSFARP